MTQTKSRPRHYTLDASVAIKWFFPEIHSASARILLHESNTLIVPDLIFPEVGNFLWKRQRTGDMTAEETTAVLQAFGKLPLQVFPSWPMVLTALEIANRSERTVYDSLYMALAVRESSLFVTADEKFYNGMRSNPLFSYLLWVEDISDFSLD